MANKPDRLEWPDVAKGICILAVIAGHMGIAQINRVVFLWHLPVFFLISGFFLRKKPLLTIIKEKALRLLGPYYLTCLAIIFISVLKDMIRRVSPLPGLAAWIGASLYGAGDNWTHPIEIKAIGAIWFLWALFFAYVIAGYLADRKYGLIFSVVIAFLGWGSITWTGYWLPLSIQAGMLSSLYLMIGYEAKKHNFSPDSIPLGITIIFGIISVLGIYVFKGYWLVHNYMGNGWIDFIFSLCFGTVIIVLSNRIIKSFKMVSVFFRYFGRNSLLILCLHLIELNMFHIKSVMERIAGYLSIEPETAAFIALIYIAKVLYVFMGTFILNRITFIRRIFGGI